MKPDTKKHVEILIFVLLGILGIFLFTYYFSYVSREAAIDFKITRQQALQRGEQYLTQQGHSLKEYRHSVIFSSNQYQAEFVEKTLGLESANRLYQKDVPIWYWECRWFKELQKEEFSCRISPDGRVVGFSHDIKDEEPRPSISEDSAKILALSYITTIPGIQASEYKLVETSDYKKPHRMDYSFIFEKDRPKIKDGSIRLSLNLQGTQLDGFYHHVHIPDTFQRADEKIYAYRSLLIYIDWFFDSGIYLGIIILLLLGFKAKQLRWKLFFPVALTLAVFALLNSYNEIPTSSYYYWTASTWYSFIGRQIGRGFLNAAKEGLMVWILGVAGWYAFRYFREKKTLLPSTGYIQRIAPRGLASATIIGYSGALIQLGYVAVFYMLGYRYFHVFSPADITYSNYLATWLPWLFPLTIALSASLNEEFTYRLFAIPFLQKLIKYRWIAIILPAFIWGFAHSFYNVEPVYIRGIEVGLVGIFLGCIYLRYGILATVIIHYVYDCVLFALPMLRSSSLYFIISGILVCLLMVLPGILLTWLSPRYKKEFLESEMEDSHPKETSPPVTDSPVDAPIPVPEPVIETPYHPADYFYYRPLNKVVISILLILALSSAGYIAWKGITQTSHIPPQYVLDKKESELKATRLVEQMGFSTRNYQKITSASGIYHGAAETYMSRLISEDSIRTIYRHLKDNQRGWRTKWFKADDPEVFSIHLDANGNLKSFRYSYKEERPGASLSRESAIILADQFLRQQAINPADYKLIEFDSEKRPNRLDWTLTYEHIHIKVKDMTVRMQIGIAGDKLSDFDRVRYDIPEDFFRRLYKSNVFNTIYNFTENVLYYGLVILLVIQLFIMFRNREISLINGLWIALLFTLFSILDSINGIPDIIDSYAYQTLTPIGIFVTKNLIYFIYSTIYAFLVYWLSITFGMACFKRLVPSHLTLPRAAGLLHPRHWGHPAYFQGLMLAITALLIYIPFENAGDWVMNHWFMSDKSWLVESYYFSYAGLDYYSPFLANLLGYLTSILWAALIPAVFFAFYFQWFQTWNLKLLLLIGAILALFYIWNNNQYSWQYRLYDSTTMLLVTGIVIGILIKITWKNWCFYLLCYWMKTFIDDGIPYLFAYHWTWKLQGIFYLLIGIIPAVVILIQYWRQRGKYPLE